MSKKQPRFLCPSQSLPPLFVSDDACIGSRCQSYLNPIRAKKLLTAKDTMVIFSIIEMLMPVNQVRACVRACADTAPSSRNARHPTLT